MGSSRNPAGGAHEDRTRRRNCCGRPAARLAELDDFARTSIVEHRYAKFRKMGNFFASRERKPTSSHALRGGGPGMVVVTTFGGNRVRGEVCMEFNGGRDCRTAQAATREEALRTATTTACRSSPAA